MFEKASRLKLRFDTARGGSISTEELWELPLSSAVGRPNLDDVAKGLFKQLKESDVPSFVSIAAKDDTVQLKFEIVKRVIDVRLSEARASEEKKANADRRQQILALIAQKENEALAGSSLDDLKALANSLT